MDLNDHTFHAIVSQIKVDGIAPLATAVRQAITIGNHKASAGSPSGFEEYAIGCRIHKKPLSGSFNLAFRIMFDDGVQWLLKTPANGHHSAFDSCNAQALASEAQTMRFLKQQTDIPIPAVHSFNTSANNLVGVPYILMDFVMGQSLYHVWFNTQVSPGKLEQIRARALQTIASAMAELSQFKTFQSGAIRFGESGDVIGIGPSKAMIPIRNDEDEVNFCPKGPMSDPLKSLFFMIDRQGTDLNCTTNLDRGMFELLRLTSKWAMETQDLQDSKGEHFALAHPDFNFQNVLVREDGALAGIIDWDGIAAVPASMGPFRYPIWLLRDWEPTTYNFDMFTGKLIDDNGPMENSPRELSHYRTMYAQFMEMALSGNTSNKGQGRRLAQLTRMSAITGVLEMAANSPSLMDCILGKIFGELVRAEPGYYDDDCLALGSVKAGLSPIRRGDGGEDAVSSDSNGRINGDDHDDSTPEDKIARNDVNAIKAADPGPVADVQQATPRSSAPPSYLALAQMLPPYSSDSPKKKITRFGLGTAEKGLRVLAKTFDRSASPDMVADRDLEAGVIDEEKDVDLTSRTELSSSHSTKKAQSRSFLGKIGASMKWVLMKIKEILRKCRSGSINAERKVQADKGIQSLSPPSKEFAIEKASGKAINNEGLENAEAAANEVKEMAARVAIKAAIKAGKRRMVEGRDHILDLQQRRMTANEFDHTEQKGDEPALHVVVPNRGGSYHPECEKQYDNLAQLDPAIVAFKTGSHRRETGPKQGITDLKEGLLKLLHSKQAEVKKQGTESDEVGANENLADEVMANGQAADSGDAGQPAKNPNVAIGRGRGIRITATGKPVATGLESSNVGQVTGQPVLDSRKPIPRNRPCPCGSRRKFKKCCGKDAILVETTIEVAVVDQPSDEAVVVPENNGSGSSIAVSPGSSQGNDSSMTSLDSSEVEGDIAQSQHSGGPQEKKSHESPLYRDEDRDDVIPEGLGEMTDGVSIGGEGQKDQAKIIEDGGVHTNQQLVEEEIVDRGGFTMEEVCYALGRGNLDEARFDRLHQGFVRLLDWTMGKW